MSEKVAPRLAYNCPRCGELIARVFTAAQLDGAVWPVVMHKSVERGERIIAEAGGRSASLEGYRGKGWQFSYLLPLMDDLSISCTKCGGKFSAIAGEMWSHAHAQVPRYQSLPTRGDAPQAD